MRNPIAENQILQVAVFALLFGIALALLPETKREPMLKFCESLSATMFSFTNLVMYFAPIGVGAAVAYTVGHMGIGVLLPLGKLLLTGYVALIAFVLVVLLPIAILARIPLGTISSGSGRAGHDCVCNEHFRGGAAARDGGHGSVRRATKDCGVRDSRGIQLQHGGVVGLFGGGVDICGTGGGDAHVVGTTTRRWFLR